MPRAPLGSRGAEYYALSPMEKAEILTHLCDEVLDTRAAREVINARQDDEMNVFGRTATTRRSRSRAARAAAATTTTSPAGSSTWASTS